MKISTNKLLGLGLAAVLALTSVVVLADGQFQGKRFGNGMMMSQKGTSMSKMTTEERLAKLKEMLDKQVAAGKITQEKADEMYAKTEEFKMKKSIFTNEEKDEIRANTQADIKAKLDAKVASGEITQEQADKFCKMNESGNLQGFPKRGRMGSPMGGRGGRMQK